MRRGRSIGPPIRGLTHHRERWEGAATELLTEFVDHHTDDKARKRNDWLRTPRTLANQVRRIAPNLHLVWTFDSIATRAESDGPSF